MSDHSTGITYKWVKNIYYGEQAKHVQELAGQGIGYIILDSGKSEVTAAFRISEDKQLSISMVELDQNSITKMEKILANRQGLHSNDVELRDEAGDGYLQYKGMREVCGL